MFNVKDVAFSLYACTYVANDRGPPMGVQTLARGRFADFDCGDLTVRSVVWVCEGLTSLRAVVACACCGLASCTRRSAR